MAIRREFLDWKQPALWSVADRLRDQYQRGEELDLDQVVVVVPGSRAGRQLLEVLVERVEQWGLRLVPPQIITIGHLPEQLYEPQRPFASDIVQQLTWVRALQQVGTDRVSSVFARLPTIQRTTPGGGELTDWPRWLEVAKILSRLHRELGAETLDFQDVASQIEPLAGDEYPRWQLLAEVQKAYLSLLDEWELWDQQTARLVAIKQKECQTEQDIFLVAVADLNTTMQRMLDQVADRVTAFIFAPPELSSRFDSHGCVVSASWQEAPIPLDDVPLLVCEGPAEQAEMVVGVVSDWSARFAASDIVVALPAEQLAPFIERQLQDRGVGVHRGAGESLRTSRPFRLLEAVGRYLNRPRFREFASLIRHPDVHDWVTSQCPGFELQQLDRHAANHLPPTLKDGPDEEALSENLVPQVAATIHRWLAPLETGPRSLDTWPDIILGLLRVIYEGTTVNRASRVGQRQWLACQAIHDGFAELRDIPRQLAPALSAGDALFLVLEQLAGQTTPIAREPEEIELLGWLELPLDLAPALVVTSFNDGLIPTSVNADQFLPNTLRRRLNLLDNQRRYARDAYALHLLAVTRELVLLVGRRDVAGDPLIPSRLAFATDDTTIARRVLHLMGEQDSEHGNNESPSAAVAPAAGRAAKTLARNTSGKTSRKDASEPMEADRETGFAVPRPEPADPQLLHHLLTLPVTAFRAYLSCPYRFYLRYVLRLEADSDRVTELKAAQFGTLLHRVLDQFGAGPCRDETDHETIREFLHEALAELVEQEFGTRRLAPVNVQLGQLRARLDGFARWQAERAREGWRIRHQEEACEVRPKFLAIDDRQVAVRGRIDRIDVHEERGEWMVLDYKSSDTPKAPRQAHFERGEWIDLQLPLYRHLATTLDIPASVQTGYIVLPKDTSKVGLLVADWTEAELAAADARAADVVRAILEQQFWPMSARPPRFADEYSGICQDSVFQPGRWRDEDDG